MVNERLKDTLWFKVGFYIPISAFLIASTWIFYNSDASVPDTYLDLNEFLEIYKIPLALLSLSVPILAMAAALHRSEQTAHQIEVQQAQNNFINHFKHLEEFKKALWDEEKNLVLWKSLEDLHKSIYPDTISGDLSPLRELKYIPLEIEVLHQSITVSSVTISKDLEAFSEDICNRLDVSYKPLSPGGLIALIPILQKAIGFSALHSPLINLSAKAIEELGTLNTIVGMTESVLDKPEERFVDLLEHGILETFSPTREDIADVLEESVVLNSAVDLLENKEVLMNNICKSLQPDGIHRFQRILKKHIAKQTESSHDAVKRLANLMTGNE